MVSAGKMRVMKILLFFCIILFLSFSVFGSEEEIKGLEIPKGNASFVDPELEEKDSETSTHSISTSSDEDKVYKVIVSMKNPKKVWKSEVSSMDSDELKELKTMVREYATDQINDSSLGHKYNSFNGFSAKLTQEEFDKLKSNSLVNRINKDREVQAFLQDSTGIINATSTWELTSQGENLTGKGETVCVIDTGVDYTHPDLGGGWGNKVIGGFRSLNDESDQQDCSDNHSACMDDNGHGTHVAGIVGANGDIKGVAPDSKIYAVKILDSGGGGYGSDIIAGIEDCTNSSEEYNISAISMSLGGENLYSDYCDNRTNASFYEEPINDAVANNISVVVATGNERDSNQISAPACIENATRVGATDKSPEVIASYSNTWALDMLVAPGTSITSTWNDGNFNSLSGTSMATPHVSGTIAIINQLLDNINKEKTPQEIENILNTTGKTIYDSGGSERNYTRINLMRYFFPYMNAYLPNNKISDNKNHSFLCNISDDYALKNVTFNLRYENGTIRYMTNKSISSENTENYHFSTNLTNISYGSYDWNCEACDVDNNCNYFSDSSLTINSFPSLDKNISNIMVIASSNKVVNLSEYFSDEDDPLNYSYDCTEDNVNISINNSLANLTSYSNNYNSTECNITADDGLNHTTSNDFTISVNALPNFTNLENLKWALNHEFVYELNASDENDENLTFSIKSSKFKINTTTGVTRNNTPMNESNETYPIEVNVSDGKNTTKGKFNITVVDIQISNFILSNDVVSEDKNQTFGCDYSSGLTLKNASLRLWYENDTLRNVTNRSIDNKSDYDFSKNITNLSDGDYGWSCSVCDTYDNCYSSPENYSLTINSFPSLDKKFSDITVITNTNKKINLSEHFSDENDPLNYSYNCTEDSVNISINNSIVNITPYTDNYNSTECNITGNDGINHTTSNNFKVSINALPSFTNLINLREKPNESFIYDLNAYDDNHENLTFSINNTSEFKINETTGLIKNTTNFNKTNHTYQIEVNVSDGINSTSRNFNLSTSILPKTDTFSPSLTTTNITDTTNVSNFTLGKENKGLINFTENVTLSYLDLDRYVNISHNRVEVNTTYLPGINKSAIVTFYNVSFTKPVIYKNGNKCSYCNSNILEKGENVSFRVEGFSYYYAEQEEEETNDDSSGGGGGGGSDSYCGDGTCDDGEDCESCSQDCGECKCTPSWVCGAWSDCEYGTKTRDCSDANQCGTMENMPITEKDCTEEKEENVKEETDETEKETEDTSNDYNHQNNNETRQIEKKSDSNWLNFLPFDEIHKYPFYVGLTLMLIAAIAFTLTIIYIIRR